MYYALTGLFLTLCVAPSASVYWRKYGKLGCVLLLALFLWPQILLLTRLKSEKMQILIAPDIAQRNVSVREMFVALSDMLPGYRGSCPDLPGYPAKILHVAEVYACGNLLQWAADRGECLVYNFGVGNSDPFLDAMGKKFKGCKVFAFDPFVNETEVPHFADNVKFFPIGLWNGHSPRHVGHGGELKTLVEIQQQLGHTRSSLTFFRSDCEGCEYGWVAQAMSDDPTIFERISQMYIEIHTVPIVAMSSLALPWTDGEPPASLVGPLYTMLTKHFKVLGSMINPGYPSDRNKVPVVLQRDGVLGYPCCRELHLISSLLAVPIKSNEQGTPDCQEPRTGKALPELDELSESFAEAFLGRRGTCTGGEAPTQFGGDAFCPSALRAAEEQKRCVVYFFGDFSVATDVDFLKHLAKDYPQCAIRAFDPRWSEKFWSGGVSATFGRNVHFRPWGIYSGQGPRVVKSVGPMGEEVIGELYTLREILRSWTSKDMPDNHVPNPRPGRISLLRLDWRNAKQCIWQREVSEESRHFWGDYLGTNSI